MKRLILMGGRPWVAGDQGENFSQVLLRYLDKEAKIALCIFAQPETDWPETEKWNKEMLGRWCGDKKLSYKTMTAENFAEVSAWADIIYVPGGDPFVLKEQLTKAGDIAKLWDGKVIAGSSAGADILCTAYVYLQDKTFGDGFGWVPATCIPHWRDDFKDYTQKDWDWAEAESIRKYPHLPVLCIPEGHHVELTVK